MKFDGQICIYCQSRPSTPTGDHVFARKFFLVGRRGNLPKVPACRQCGDEKSRLEHYLTSVLPFGGRHADAHENLVGLVPDRLAKNQRLHRELESGRSRVWTKEPSGLLIQTTTVPIDCEKIEQLFVFIVKALMWHHWQVQLGAESFVDVHLAAGEVARAFARLSSLRAKARLKVDVGDGTFIYEGAQGTDNDTISVWDFSIYGGVKLTGDAPGEEISQIRAMTGPKRVQQNADARAKARGLLLLRQ